MAEVPVEFRQQCWRDGCERRAKWECMHENCLRRCCIVHKGNIFRKIIPCTDDEIPGGLEAQLIEMHRNDIPEDTDDENDNNDERNLQMELFRDWNSDSDEIHRGEIISDLCYVVL